MYPVLEVDLAHLVDVDPVHGHQGHGKHEDIHKLHWLYKGPDDVQRGPEPRHGANFKRCTVPTLSLVHNKTNCIQVTTNYKRHKLDLNLV